MKRLPALLLVALAALLPTQADAQYTIRKLTNKSGGTVAAARVVVADTSNASAFTTTATDDANRVIGVTTASCNANAIGDIAIIGYTEVYCAGAVALGDYIVTSSASAGHAETNGADPNSAFAIAVEAGTDTNINCVLLGPTPNFTGATLAPASISLVDNTGILSVGTDNDVRYYYDEATDDRAEWTDGTNVLAFLKDNGTDGIFGANTIQVTSGTTATLYNTTATTVNAFGEATAITIGATAGATITLRGGTLIGNTTTQNVFNTTATTLNIGGAGTAITLGAATGKTSFRHGIESQMSLVGGNQYASATPGPDYPIYIYNRPADTSGTKVALTVLQEPTGTGTVTTMGVQASTRTIGAITASAIYAFDTNVQTGNNASGVATSAYSLRAAMTNNGLGNIVTYYGVRVISSGSTGTVTNFNALEVDANTSATIGTTTKYGLRIGNISGASGTNSAITTGTGIVVFGDDLAVNGGDFTSTASTFNLLASPTTIAFGAGASTAINIGHASGLTTFASIIKHPGTYGEVYITSGATTQTTNATPGTYDIMDWSAGSNGNSNDCTPSIANDRITVTRAGTYRVSVNISFSGTLNETYRVQVYNNTTATAYTDLMLERKLGSGGDVDSASLLGFVTVAANDQLVCRVTCTSAASKAFTPTFANFNVLLIGA